MCIMCVVLQLVCPVSCLSSGSPDNIHLPYLTHFSYPPSPPLLEPSSLSMVYSVSYTILFTFLLHSLFPLPNCIWFVCILSCSLCLQYQSIFFHLKVCSFVSQCGGLSHTLDCLNSMYLSSYFTCCQ